MSLAQLAISESAKQSLVEIASTLVNISGVIKENSTLSIDENVSTVLAIVKGKVAHNILK